ncbi:MAG: LysR family transcriptional regulator [Burkholderiales bacterium]|nr:LysR family transcriptional regulator [Burkholderiales bacterium]MDE2610588.1 LysR family transcriptional regulator [Burkholderiales bacterium]
MAIADDYEVLLAVLDHGSLTAAAKSLGRSLQAVSRALAGIERQLNVSLFTRTTRQVHPTPACLAFARRIRPAMREINAARDELIEQNVQLRGAIRVAAPSTFGAQYLVGTIAEFMGIHAGVSVELIFSERHADLAKEGIDLAVRLGNLPDSDLKARRVAEFRRVLFASPKYLAARGHPREPSDLTKHECILRKDPRHDVWEFGADGRAVEVHGRLRANAADACSKAAAAGHGIARAPLWQVRDMVESGAVEVVLAEFEPKPVPVHLVWLAGRSLPRRVRGLVDFLAERIAAQGL